jgi:hypothetical protein
MLASSVAADRGSRAGLIGLQVKSESQRTDRQRIGMELPRPVWLIRRATATIVPPSHRPDGDGSHPTKLLKTFAFAGIETTVVAVAASIPLTPRGRR